MKLLKKQSDSASQTAECIKNGGVVIIPTDTIYGFSAKVPEGDGAIRHIKGREETKPFIELIADPRDITLYTDMDVPPRILALWPGALTVIVPRKAPLSGTVALRCPGDAWLREVISLSGSAIYSTSVNRSGSPSLWKIADIEQEFSLESALSLIVDDGDKPGGVPSTLIDITSGTVRVLRQGAVHVD